MHQCKRNSVILSPGHWDFVSHGSDARHRQTHQTWRGEQKATFGSGSVLSGSHTPSQLFNQLFYNVPDSTHSVGLLLSNGRSCLFYYRSNLYPRPDASTCLTCCPLSVSSGAPVLHNCITLHVLLQVRAAQWKHSYSEMWNWLISCYKWPWNIETRASG